TIAKEAGFDVAIINENIMGRRIWANELRNVDVLCLSCITATVDRGKEIAKEYKDLRKNNGLEARTIIGGIHASMLPDDVTPYFDQVVVGEAENSILDILSGKIKEKIVYCQRPEDLDSLPIPDFKLIKSYERIQNVPVMTSRGCPHHCNFCSVTAMFGKKYRSQSPDRVLREVSRYKKGTIFFIDDNFTANLKRSNEIFDKMIGSGFNRPWTAQVRTEITKKEEFVTKMKRAGCNTVYVGFESVNPETLKSMKKGQDVEDIRRSIASFQKQSILVHGMFVLGGDSDTRDVFKMTQEFCQKTGLDYVQYGVLTPIPGSEVYSQIEKEGRFLHKNWSLYDGLHTVFSPKNMSADELQRGMIECFSDFYSYTNGVNEGLNLVFDTIKSAVKSLHTKAYFPSLLPFLMKFAGREIIKRWMTENKSYLAYLKGR
ncbi:MAG: radical SAM protein, partial [Candidatus Desantisbacteria bacterium]